MLVPIEGRLLACGEKGVDRHPREEGELQKTLAELYIHFLVIQAKVKTVKYEEKLRQAHTKRKKKEEEDD